MAKKRRSLKSLLKYLNEAGYSGQGHTSGAESFYGTYYGFGGDMQLAKKPVKAVRDLKKQRDEEAAENFKDQQQRNRGYPAAAGFEGGDGGMGIGSGARIPNTIAKIGKSPDELDALFARDSSKDYWGFNDELEEPDEDDDRDIEEQMSGAGQSGGGGGAQRSVASDGNYRNLQGFPRHNALEKQADHIPELEGDIDGDGEEDEYLSDEEYVNDVMRLNGLQFAPGEFKRIFGVSTLEEQGAWVSPGYEPEPDRPTERYKQGNTIEDHEPDATKKLIKHVDYTGGHTDVDAADFSPGAQAYGQIGQPKDFVPEDWEQRHWKTKEDEEAPMDMMRLEEMIRTAVSDALAERRVMSAKKLMKKLRKNKSPGCDHVRQKGSHATYKCDICQTVVPVHGSKDIKSGTLKSIERDLKPCLGDDWLDEAIQKLVARELEEAFTGIKDVSGDGKSKGGSEAFEKNRKKILDYDKGQKPDGTDDLKNYHMGEE